MTRKTILSSLVTIVMCLALIAGSTYALFTSEDSVNIAVTSGKVKVTATANNLKLYSMGEEMIGTADEPATFENGGTAVLNQDVLTLTNITPGDKVTFDIIVENESNVAILYSLIWRVDGALVNGLVAKANGNDIVQGRTAWETWTGEKIQTINVSIELPVDYATQSESASITFAVEAYQGNASFIANVAELNQKLASATDEDFTLIGAYEADGVISVPATYTGTITLLDCAIASIQAEKNLNLVVGGSVVVKAIDSSAITAENTINIAGSGKLSAIAADVNGGFGIGGMNTAEINIQDVTILKATGAFVQKDFISDTKYGKSEPEGGAAIGSGLNDAVINLENVTINEALGGSKAAGIGARYHTGVIINITDCTINKVVGGNASAAIGSSRVSGNAAESGTTINITGSDITAIGGQAGAGIGSGYDTHCLSKQPLCTINISDSTINATGGKYAAGVGSGYHNAALAGEIKNSTVTAVSGEKFYKATYTEAQDIGFGVVDPAREGQQIGSYLIYNGEKIYLSFVSVVSTADDVVTALTAGKDIILANDIELTAALAVEDEVSIELNGKTLSTKGLDLKNGGVISNGTITSSAHTNMTPHLKVSGGELTMVDVTVDVNHHLNANVYWAEATAMEIANATAVLNNCNIKIDNPTGAQWVYSYGVSLNNAKVTMNGGSITAECAEGTAANGPTNPNAISAMGASEITLNNVEVTATNYGTTVKGHLIINTTDTTITSANIVDNQGGSHEINYIGQ